MARADASDPAIKAAFDEIKNTSSSTNWILLGYVPKSDSKLTVVGKGDGGFEECIENFSDGKVLFSLVSFTINNMKKFVYISWCGEAVVGMKKGLFNNHANDVAAFLKGFHVQINARSEADLNEKNIVAKLQKAGGASYDSGAKNQGATESVPTNVAQGRQQATKSNVQRQNADKSDYDKKNESESFWAQQREDEQRKKQAEQEAKSRPKEDYTKSQERDQFWAQQRANEQDQQQKPPQRSQPQVQSGNSSSMKNRFENPPPSQPAPAPSRPAPAKKASAPPPPRQPEPEPEPEPEPVQTYAEPEPTQESYTEQASYDDNQGYSNQQHGEDYSSNTNNNTNNEEWADQGEEQPQDSGQQEYVEEQTSEPAYTDQQYAEDQQYTDQAPASGGVLCVARALYDYQAENDNDLSFNEGDMINVLDKSDPSGWWQGEKDGVVGFFPSNFVEEV